VRPDTTALRATYRGQIERLRALGVEVAEIGRGATDALAERFAQEFVDPDLNWHFLAEIRKAETVVDFDRWIRPDRLSRGRARGCLGWLAAGRVETRCVRLDRRGGMPALRIDLGTMAETWANSWPGVFVHFDAGRALAVTVHYEIFQCDLHACSGSPYR
jgi:hypothetical protein